MPVYNTRPYLERCVRSIVSQSFTDLEVLLVDDGSTDGSGALCDALAASDKRVAALHIANGGPSKARNTGIERATGQFLAFVDSDDFVAPDFAQTLLDALHATGAGMAVCQWQEMEQHEAPEPERIKPRGSKMPALLPQNEAIDRVFYQQGLNCSTCNRIFRREMFDTLRFPEGMLYEDLAVTYSLLKLTPAVALVPRVMYFYLHHEASITGSFKPQRLHVLKILDELEAQVAAEAPQHLKAVQSRKLSACFNMLGLMPAGDANFKEFADHCWNNIKALRTQEITNPRTRLKNKLGALLSLSGRAITTKCLQASYNR